MAANFLLKQILKHGRKKGTKKVKNFLNFIKTGKYKGKDLEKEVNKLNPKELDLETMPTPSQKKMKKGGIAKRGFGKAYMKGKR
jgi:hypothetical protein|tara:strand:+ start:2482 stop:2733 length:252 start_codon:yes stop_codon:yes gene_type:complete